MLKDQGDGSHLYKNPRSLVNATNYTSLMVKGSY